MSINELSHRAKRSPTKPKETKKQREQRLKKQNAAKQALRQRLAVDDDAVLTFAEWCALNGFSVRVGRNVIKSGDGPIITGLSDRRIGITRKNNREWQASRARS